MLQEVKSPVIDHRSTEDLRRREASIEVEAADYDDGLLGVAGRVMVACYAAVFAIALFTFWRTGETLFAVAIGIGLALMYFGIPTVMMGVRSKLDRRWRNDMDRRTSSVVDVWTGPIQRWEAIAQIVSIPIAVLLGFAILAMIWTHVRV